MYASSRPLAYAPTPHSYIPSATLTANINLDEEVKLSTNPSERDLLESLAEIYSIVLALDGLEKAFNKDSITDAEYTELCTRLLKQYKGNLSDERVSTEFGDLESFKAKWNIECPRATERIRVGLPATMTHATSSIPQSNPTMPTPATTSASTQSAIIATENFITFLDALRLGIGSKDQLHPLLSEVIQSTNKVTDADFEGRANIIKWLIKLNSMKAHEELSVGDNREVEFEMDAAYRGFKAMMS